MEYNNGTRRYGISFRVLYSIAHEWDFELNTTREIPYLQAALYYFGYLINTVALSWREKSTLWTNENKRIDNPRIKSVKCLGDQAQYGKKTVNHYKTTMGVIFNIKNCHLLTFTLRQKIFGCIAKIGPWKIITTP